MSDKLVTAASNIPSKDDRRMGDDDDDDDVDDNKYVYSDFI